jgi:CubicO group peptidase (beta-lactamase class C family)
MKIRYENDEGVTVTSPTSRDMTVWDLMRHTSGLIYGARPKYKGEAAELGPNLQQYVDALGELPLAADPGTFWLYGSSTDVLGRLVEVWSGQTLDVFFEERIFKALNMPDTAFWAPEEKHDRLTKLYRQKNDGTLTPNYADPSQDRFRWPVRWFSGGGGLTGTTMDYARFCQMMLNGGELEGVRLLKKETVELMTRDHLGDKINKQYGFGSVGPAGGFGLGFSVILGPPDASKFSQVGSYAWGGAASTVFWIDPKAELYGIFMIQVMPNRFSPQGVGGGSFRGLVYEAIEQ